MKENRTQTGRRYFKDSEENLLSIECSKCGVLKFVDEYHKNKGTFMGVNTRCKECVKGYYFRNHEKELKRKEIYREARKDEISEYYRKWSVGNREKLRLADSRREARKSSLPDTLTEDELSRILSRFEGCALTGDSDYQLDHVIPISAGKAGTTVENIIPLRADLNQSKSSKNIFEWFKMNRERFNLSEETFKEVISYLAEVNSMNDKEYEDYVYSCLQ